MRSKPVNLFILDLLLVPHEDACHGCYEPPGGSVLALKPPPYATHQCPPGAFRVQIGVELGDLVGTSEPLAGQEAAVVGEDRQQALPLRTGACCRTRLLKPGQQQAHAVTKQGNLLHLPFALLDSLPE